MAMVLVWEGGRKREKGGGERGMETSAWRTPMAMVLVWEGGRKREKGGGR